jgi:hypothetical protein
VCHGRSKKSRIPPISSSANVYLSHRYQNNAEGASVCPSTTNYSTANSNCSRTVHVMLTKFSQRVSCDCSSKAISTARLIKSVRPVPKRSVARPHTTPLSQRTRGSVRFIHDKCCVNRNESRPILLAVKRPPLFCSKKGRGRNSLRSAWKANAKKPNNWPIEPAQRQDYELNANLNSSYIRVKLAYQKTEQKTLANRLD